jgi:aromatic-L-amino-acid decarboxylase
MLTDPTIPPLGDLSPEEFARHGHQVIDWIARYLGTIDERPVMSRVAPGEIAAMLTAAPPAEGEPLERILGDVERVIVPGITHWNHPAFLAYFAISASAPGIMGEVLYAALDGHAMLW